MNKKIVTVIGARPQFIKAAAVSRVISETADVNEVLVHTGQHYDENMSKVFFEEMQIPEPRYNLGIGSGSHGKQTGEMLGAIEKVLFDEEPDWMLIYGDTNSTLAGAVAASKMHIPIAHVEAGLRSFNRIMPEEINRVLADHVSSLLFAPTEAAVANLKKEGIYGDSVLNVGDVMFDVALYYGEYAERNSNVLSELGINPKDYILATVHRAENTDDPERLMSIVNGLAEAANQLQVICPLHPRTRNKIKELGLDINKLHGIKVIDPVGYIDMVMLEKNAKLIATDSGGVQKEAFFHKVPCITLRSETEWVELVDLKWNKIVSDSSSEVISSEIIQSLDIRGIDGLPYGDGDASRKIVSSLLEFSPG